MGRSPSQRMWRVHVVIVSLVFTWVWAIRFWFCSDLLPSIELAGILKASKDSASIWFVSFLLSKIFNARALLRHDIWYRSGPSSLHCPYRLSITRRWMISKRDILDKYKYNDIRRGFVPCLSCRRQSTNSMLESPANVQTSSMKPLQSITSSPSKYYRVARTLNLCMGLTCFGTMEGASQPTLEKWRLSAQPLDRALSLSCFVKIDDPYKQISIHKSLIRFTTFCHHNLHTLSQVTYSSWFALLPRASPNCGNNIYHQNGNSNQQVSDKYKTYNLYKHLDDPFLCTTTLSQRIYDGRYSTIGSQISVVHTRTESILEVRKALDLLHLGRVYSPTHATLKLNWNCTNRWSLAHRETTTRRSRPHITVRCGTLLTRCVEIAWWMNSWDVNAMAVLDCSSLILLGRNS
jgi:hypothetical protein